MTDTKDFIVDAALDVWRHNNVKGDWPDVLARAASDPARTHARRLRLRPAWSDRLSPRRARVALAIAAVVLIATPAFAVVGDRLLWPAKSHVGARLEANLSGADRVTLQIASHGALVTRSHGRVTFVAPRRDPRRAFLWRLSVRTGSVQSAAILLHGHDISLCSPCAADASGRFVLAGQEALDIFNQGARLDVVVAGAHKSALIRLERLR